MRIIYTLICCVAIASTFSRIGSAESLARPARYLVATTSTVTLSVPKPSGKGEHLYRNARGKWVPLKEVQESEGSVTFTLSPELLAGGKTVILLGKPRWLNVNDTTPPKAARISVDGRQLKPVGDTASACEVNLGWIEALPRTLEIQVADTQNPLDPSSVALSFGGQTRRAGSPGLDFLPESEDRRKGRIVCSLPRLGVSEAEGVRRIEVRCRDFAPDSPERVIGFNLTVTRLPDIDFSKPAATTSDGVRILVDSIHPGYENVECMLDGQLQTPGTTTFGSTWASTETSAAHWMCFVFPKPRSVSGLQVSWANYQSTFWASERYAVLTWDGRRWVTANRVENNPAVQTSAHNFTARMTDRVLVWVPSGGNHPQRPDLMWVTEVKMLP